MTTSLAEAIEILTTWKDRIINSENQRAREALVLGLEALKRLETLRKFPGQNPTYLLPGETEE